MRSFTLVLLLTHFSLAPVQVSAGDLHLPLSLQSGRISISGQVRAWTPDTMYEHVNGEAELLKRYGARRLSYILYESAGDDTLSVDILDMGEPVNAFGLFSLYAGCEGEAYTAFGATVLAGDFTYYAYFGQYFLRFDVQTPEGTAAGRTLVGEFLSGFSGIAHTPEPLPPPVGILKQVAVKPCEVTYHPEHTDYDLESGPGYIWTSPVGVCYLRVHPSRKAAEAAAADLKNKDVPVVHIRGNAVAWSKEKKERMGAYLENVLEKVNN